MSIRPFTDDSHTWARGSTGSADQNKPLKPGLVVMLGTDSHWIHRQDRRVIQDYYTTEEVDNAPMMNCGTPGMRLAGIQRWSVQESLDSLTDSATLEMMNALPVSQIETTLQTSLQGTSRHSSRVKTHWFRNNDGVQVSANEQTAKFINQVYKNFEERIIYREFYPETITVANASEFPQPEVPVCERNETNYWPADDANGSLNAVGAYYIQVGNEVMRVTSKTGNVFEIPAGGRAVNGILQPHSPGETVKLLGFGPFTGEWTAYGYLTQNELRPQASLLRPGQCLVSYEGYGNFNDGKMIKQPWTPTSNRYYEFTGYWFVKGQDLTLSEDGVPRVTFELASAGNILEQTKITTETVRMLGPNESKQKASWAKNAFDKANHYRNITGDWVDYSSWNPAHPNSVPLSIKTLYAQHKAFFDHMTSTQFGKDCEYCQEEYREFVKKKKPGSDPVGEARAVGKHIYTESIRVFDDAVDAYKSAGPLVTYGRLMIELAKITWEMPLYGSPTGQNEPSGSSTRWSKAPQQLWDNMSQFKGTGLCWSSALSFRADQFEKAPGFYPSDRNSKGYRNGLNAGIYDGPSWISQLNVAENLTISYALEPLAAPFDATYEKQPWYQPVLDLADINRMSFTFTRQGFPVFAPRGLNLRGVSYKPDYSGRDDNPGQDLSASNYPRPGGSEGFWNLDWGRSISSYNFSFKPEGALTKVYVSGTDAFGNPFTVPSSGTGVDITGQLVWYSSIIGNKEALEYTGGVQQVDTMSLDNLVLGLDWATSPASYSLKLDRDNQGIIEISKLPALPKIEANQVLQYKKKANKGEQVKNLQKVYNFLRLRSYVNAAQYKNEYIKTLTEDGVFGRETEAAVSEMQRWIRALPDYELTSRGEQFRAGVKVDGTWGNKENKVIKDWLEQNQERIKADVWWYALGGYGWEYFVGAVTGLAIPQKKVSGSAGSGKQEKNEQGWTTDNVALRKRIRNWQQTFVKQALNFGNQAVEESVNKATVRTIQTIIADPRICVGDVIYANIPGHIEQVDEFGQIYAGTDKQKTGATYITQLSRNLDLSAGSYTASYSGYRYKVTKQLNDQNKQERNFFNY